MKKYLEKTNLKMKKMIKIFLLIYLFFYDISFLLHL